MIRTAFLAILLLVCHTAFAASPQHGEIAADATWTGDVEVTGDVLVRAGITLHIKDATVRVARGAEIRVEGTLRATKSHFSSAESKPAPGDWKGIVIEPNALAFSPPPQAPSSIEDCTIEHAHTGIRIRGHKLSPEPAILGCTVARCRWGGIVVEDTAKPRIERNKILEICLNAPSDQGRPLALIDCAEAVVSSNEIVNCSDVGIFLTRTNHSIVKDNKTQSIHGGPGPGPGGYYKLWAFALLLLDSDDNRISGNTLIDTAYTTISLAYGSDRNVVEHNRCEITLDSLNVLGDSRDNVFRDNTVAGGWSVMYVTGDVPVRYERCNADGTQNGSCFTARTGTPTFVDCTWNKTVGFNIWGNSRVTVERCKLRDTQQYAVSLQDDAVGTLIDCEFDKNAIRVSDNAKGRIVVQNRLMVKAVDDADGKAVSTFRVTAKPADGSAAVSWNGADQAPALTELVVSVKGRQQTDDWSVHIEADGFRPADFVAPMHAPTTQTVRLVKR